MTVEEKFRLWMTFDADTAAELSAVADDPKEMEDRFYKDLAFGTGGLRGIMGAGSNRMNRYTVGKASWVLQIMCWQTARCSRKLRSPTIRATIPNSLPKRPLPCSVQRAYRSFCGRISCRCRFFLLPRDICSVMPVSWSPRRTTQKSTTAIKFIMRRAVSSARTRRGRSLIV